MVAREQEMVAVVDPAAEFRIQVRTTAAARMMAGLVNLYPAARSSQLDRCGKSSEAGADHMHRTQPHYHTRPCRNTSQSLSVLDTLTRVAGSHQFERSKAESVAR